MPGNPAVVQPVDKIGAYGGTMNLALLGASDVPWLDRVLGCESLVRWDPMWSCIVPNLAQSWTVNDDATEYTFRLREGLRWSDGHPFTADDIVFWNETIFRGEVYRMSSPPAWMRAKGQPVVVEKRDEVTVVFRYASPNGLLLQGLAGFQGDEPVSYPRHVLGRFHPGLEPEQARAALQQEGGTNWMELMRRAMGFASNVTPRTRWRSATLPRLTAWQLVPGHGLGESSVIEARRNPYYWKVDTAGRPLPYIDAIRFKVVDTPAQLVELALRGEIDFGERSLTTGAHLPQLTAGQASGGYRFLRIVTDSGNLAVIALNLTHRDAARRALYQNLDFRAGLSFAIDRGRIMREVLGQPGVPCQMAPRPESPLYNNRLATQYTAFDRDEANRRLDVAGLRRRDEAGRRLGPDGRTLVIRVEVAQNQTVRVEAMKRVRQDWEAVGVGVELVVEEARLLLAQRAANRLDAAAWAGDGGLDVVMDPRYYLPVSDESIQAVAWARWFNDPRDRIAERPPDQIQEQMRLYREVQATNDAARRHDIMAQILGLAADAFPVIGVCTADDVLALVKQDLRNVPAVMMSSGRSFPAPAPCNPCQFFFDPPRTTSP